MMPETTDKEACDLIILFSLFPLNQCFQDIELANSNVYVFVTRSISPAKWQRTL